jgi:hypothetical protein
MKSVNTFALLCVLCSTVIAGAGEKPNIVYIICDDLGYGDVQCLAPETSKIPTPNADRLASEGMIFTDAHSGSSVCSPTRYGIMTGRYSWRTWLQKGVVTGFEPSLIAADRPTVASFLKSQGYATAAIGKWHLNFEYLNPETGKSYTQKEHDTPPVGAKIPDGPINRGFDYYHGFHHARNMEAVIENDRVVEHDDVINMLPRLTKKSVAYIESRAGKDQPFFLYLPLGSPHTPIVPSPEWKGKSGLGSYGDFVMQTDWSSSQVITVARRRQTSKALLRRDTSSALTCEVQKRISGMADIVFRLSFVGREKLNAVRTATNSSAYPISLQRSLKSWAKMSRRGPVKTVSVFCRHLLESRSNQLAKESFITLPADTLLIAPANGS